MKALVCEMCGGRDLLKTDGMYICQNCNTKYTIEEAKKLLVEVTGTVDVSGSTVKVDNSSFVQKSLENARRAKEKEDWEECEKYYNMVEQHDPKNIEAIFYSSYSKAKMAMVEPDRFKREQKMNVLQKSISVIDDNYDTAPEKYEENKEMIRQMSRDLLALVTGKFVFNQKTVNGIATENDTAYTYAMFINLCLAWVDTLQNIIKLISDEKKTVYLWKIIRTNYAYIYAYTSTSPDTYAQKIEFIDTRLSSLEPGYVPETLPPRVNKNRKMSLGFILFMIICGIIAAGIATYLSVLLGFFD